MKRFFSGVSGKIGILLVLALGLVPVLWFRKGLLIAGGDAYLLLNPGAFADSFIYAWNNQIPNAGGVLLSIPKLIPMVFFWTILGRLNLSLLIIERSWIILLFLLPGLSMYYLMSQIHDRFWAKLVASFFYMFNLFVMAVGPFQDNIKPVLIALPLMLALWIKGLEESKGHSFIKYAILLGLCSFIYSGSNVNPPSIVVIPLTLFLYLIFRVAIYRGIPLGNLKFVLMTAASYLLLNFWWLVNFIASIARESGLIQKAATFTALGSGGITDFFRLLGSWGWRSGSYNMAYFPYAQRYDEPLLLVLSFSLPILVFLAVILWRRNRWVYFFTLLALAGLFLSKGTAEPLGFIYRWLWEKVPGFWVFREPFAKFTLTTVFAYSVLLGFVADYFYQKVSGFSWLKKYNFFFFVSYLIPLIISLTVLYVTYPMFTGEVIWDHWNGSVRSIYAKVPDYIFQAGDYLSKKDKDARVFLTPKGGYGVAYNWVNGFSTADAPAVILLSNQVLRQSVGVSPANRVVESAYQNASSNNGNGFTRLLSLMNVDYVLQENDLDWRYSQGALTPVRSNKFLAENGFTVDATFGLFDQAYLSRLVNEEPNQPLHDALNEELLGQPALVLYKMPQETVLPRFYVPRKIVFSNSYSSIDDILSFSDYVPRTAIYFTHDLGSSVSSRDGQLPKPAAIYIKPEKVDFTVASSQTVDTQGKFIDPKTSILPDSPFYFLVKWREQRLLDGETDLLRKTDQMLWLSSKRLMELGRMADLNKSNLFPDIFNRYSALVHDTVGNLEKLSRERPDSYQLITKADAFFVNQKEQLAKLQDRLSGGDFQEKLGAIYGLFRDISLLVSKRGGHLYLFDQSQAGVYAPLVRLSSGAENYFEENNPLETMQLSVDNITTTHAPALKRPDGWYEYPEISLSVGNHNISFPNVSTKNLISGGSFEDSADFPSADYLSVSNEALEGARSLKIRVDKYEEKEIGWPLSPLRHGQNYRLSFDYKTLIGVPLKFLLRPEGGSETARLGLSDAFNETELKIGNGWQHFERELIWEPEQTAGKLSFALSSGEDSSASLLDNLRFEVVPDFDLILLADTLSPASAQTTPKITFSEINPTRYRVLISGAKDPYTLVFSDSFHDGWKAYITKAEGQNRTQLGASSDGKIYLDGDVKRVTSPRTFFSSDFLKFWDRKLIPEERHLMTNGFANSWYITPEDAGLRSDYEIIVEFWPQRLFYFGLLVSGVTLLLCLLYLVRYKFKHHA